LFTHSVRSSESIDPEPSSAVFTSRILKLFVEEFEQTPNARILDVGLTCGANISFLADRVRRVCVCDMFRALALEKQKGWPPGFAVRQLDFPPQSISGVLLWDLIDRLDDDEGAQLIELCRTMVKPGGKMILFAYNEKTVSDEVNAFVIGTDYQLKLRPYSYLNLPLHRRQNRDILELLIPFTPVKSFIYRSGFREFLVRNN
jgi:hypothetical protein